MKGIHIFLVSLFLMLCVGGYLLSSYWIPTKNLDVWDLVPESAILVYESTSAVENWNEVQSTPVWNNLENIPHYAGLRSNIEHLDSLSGSEGHLHKLLRSKSFTFSLHRISKQALDYVYFIPVEGISDLQMIQDIEAEFKNRDDYKFQQRTYQDLVIHEAVNQEYEEVFSYMMHKDYFIGSFTPFLIEDVIRNLSGKSKNSFAAANPKVFEVARLDNDQGNIYINNQKIPQLLSVFVHENLSPELSHLGNLAQSTFIDIKVTPEKILFNGFSVSENINSKYLASVAGTQGNPLGFRSIIPNDLAVLYHLSFKDPDIWHGRLRSYWDQHQSSQLQAWNGIADAFNWDPLELVKLQDQEIGLAVLSTVEEEDPDRLIYLRFADLERGLSELSSLAVKTAEIAGDSLYVESYGDREITQINLSEFPSMMWGGLFNGFDQCFFMPVREYVVISNSIVALKELDNSIEREDTWGKSIAMNEFLDNSLQEANLSYFVNLPKSWNLLKRQLSGDWLAFVDLHQETLNRFKLLGFQFSDIGDKFYTSGILTYNENTIQLKETPRFQNNQQVYTESPITSKPFIVRNHNNGSREVLLQDSLKFLYLIGGKGRMLWQDSLGGSICGNVTQIDYYKNNKLQYLLATAKDLHIIDRNGNSIEGFPVSVPTKTRLRNVGAIDYDNSKRYRIIASDESGSIFMFDKTGKLLDGWNPKVMQDQLVMAPQHIRIRDKDCIIAVQENGMVHIMNRRGQHYPGFPLDLKGSTSGPLYVEKGTDFSRTFFTAVTSQGLLVRFDLNGKIIEKKQLVKPTKDTYYQLCLDPLRKYFVIKQQNANRLGILNRKGAVIFEKDYLSNSDLIVQYYLLANDHTVFAVTDPVQQFTYFYNKDGELINAAPIESNSEIAMLYFENQSQHQVYSVYDNKFALLSF